MPGDGLPTALAGATTCRIVTRGRRSGASHAVTVWFAPAGTHLYVAVRHGLRSDWLQNALAQQHVMVSRRNSSWQATASLVDDADERLRAVEAFAAKYVQHKSIIRAWRAEPPRLVRLELDTRDGSVPTAAGSPSSSESGASDR